MNNYTYKFKVGDIVKFVEDDEVKLVDDVKKYIGKCYKITRIEPIIEEGILSFNLSKFKYKNVYSLENVKMNDGRLWRIYPTNMKLICNSKIKLKMLKK